MEIYTPKPKIKLSPVVRNGREFVEVTFGNDNDIRLSLSKEENVLLVGGRAYLPAEDFVLAEFFDRYVKMAFIDYSAIKETAPRKEEDKRPPLPEGYLEKLQQVRYSDHTVRVYTSYFRDFQQYFEGRKIETVTPDEINDYLLYARRKTRRSSNRWGWRNPMWMAWWRSKTYTLSCSSRWIRSNRRRICVSRGSSA